MLFRFLVCNVRTCSAAALWGFSFLGSLASFCFPSACAWRPSAKTAGLFTNSLVIGHYFFGGKSINLQFWRQPASLQQMAAWQTMYVYIYIYIYIYYLKMCLNHQMAFVQILRQPPTPRARINSSSSSSSQSSSSLENPSVWCIRLRPDLQPRFEAKTAGLLYFFPSIH